MIVRINGENRELPEHASVRAMLEQLNLWQELPPRGIAVAVNEDVVPMPEWESRTLSPDDSVLLITATQGG